MKCIIEKNIGGHTIEVFENNDYFEIYKDGYFDTACDNMQEVIDNFVEIIGFLILVQLRK